MVQENIHPGSKNTCATTRKEQRGKRKIAPLKHLSSSLRDQTPEHCGQQTNYQKDKKSANRHNPDMNATMVILTAAM